MLHGHQSDSKKSLKFIGKIINSYVDTDSFNLEEL